MPDTENRIVGRGEIWFDQFTAGTTTPTGELYFGNTPELTLSISTESLDHYSSDHGLKELDQSVDLSVDMSGSFQCDNISMANIALWYLGEEDSSVIATEANVSETLTDIIAGRTYQLGTSSTYPNGRRSITSDGASISGGASLATSEYTFDGDLGRLTFNDTTTADGLDVVVQYDQAAYTRDVTVSGNSSLYGRLRFISDNPVGRNRDYFFPYVKLSADGDFALKGDDWQTMGFTFKALKLTDRERVYVSDRASTA